VVLALIVVGGYSGRTLIRNADWQSNFTLFQSAYQVSPSSATANQHWALELRRAGRPAEAIPLLETAIAIQPRFPEAHYGLAGAYVETGRPAEAIPAYQAMLGMVPNTPFMTVPVYLGLGNAYQEAGRHEEALDALDTALRLNPQLVQARFARVHLLVALRRVDEARGALAEAESRFPNHPAARSAREELGRASGVEPSPDP
jgi:tetratricopeptide (TPR) repeat protein